MIKLKSFLKKTRTGKVLKIVREHYLRDDLGCGSEACQDCPLPMEVDGNQHNSALSSSPTSLSSLFSDQHYIVIDTNIILNQIDILEVSAKDGGFKNIIVLQTVLEEVRHRSSPIYKRLRDILSDPSRNFFVFINEHHKNTYIERNRGESANDRNDRAIRTAALWYRDHLKPWQIGIVLITDDADNRRKAQEANLKTVSVQGYVEAMNDSPMMIDKLNRTGSGSNAEIDKKFLFPEHLSPAQINSGIKTGNLHQGIFYLSRTNFQEGTVNCEGFEKPVLIQGLEQLNRAVDGDVVAFQLLDKAKWTASAEVVLEDKGYDPGDTLDHDKEIIEQAIKAKDIQPTGRIVGIIRRKWRQYCGMLQENPSGTNATKHIFVPAEKKIPKIRIETRQAAKLKGQRIIVAPDAWPRHSRYPVGHFIRCLGPIGDKATENQVLLLEHDIPHSPFSEAVLDCLPELPWTITSEDVEKRVDLRKVAICSVDPPGCTDIDDALHCITLPNGNFQVGVHIADVSHFIRPGTAIDQEAANRSTTVYLTDRRIDMVPELLSSNLCSLRGNVERFAFSCIWEMNDQAEIITTKFHKSIIKSQSAMTYEQAQNKIDDPNDNDQLAIGLRNLLKLSKILKAKRIANGALLLASSEIRFSVDSETADPIDVEVKQMRETNSMVEEFMLAANISAATKIFQEFPDCAMLRRHPEPPVSNFENLVKAGKQQGFEIKVDTGKNLADTLNSAVDPSNSFLNTMLRMIATRCMMQAVYMASGSVEEAEFKHYGLAVPIYTHFTSPIRRYADVIVHRLLAVAVGADITYPELLDKKKTQEIANNINYRHRMAQYASRASVNLHTHIFFRNKKTMEEGYILFIRQNAFQVLIPKYGLEGTLYIKTDSGFVFDEDIPSQTHGDVTLTLFQKLKVQLSLDQSNVQHEKLELKLIEPYIPGYSVSAEVEKNTESSKRPNEDEEQNKNPNKSEKRTKWKKM